MDRREYERGKASVGRSWAMVMIDIKANPAFKLPEGELRIAPLWDRAMKDRMPVRWRGAHAYWRGPVGAPHFAVT